MKTNYVSAEIEMKKREKCITYEMKIENGKEVEFDGMIEDNGDVFLNLRVPITIPENIEEDEEIYWDDFDENMFEKL